MDYSKHRTHSNGEGGGGVCDVFVTCFCHSLSRKTIFFFNDLNASDFVFLFQEGQRRIGRNGS